MGEQKTDLRSIRNRFSTLGLAYTALVGSSFVAYFFVLILEGRHPEALNPEAPWWVWLRAFAPTYLVGLPVCIVLLRRLRDPLCGRKDCLPPLDLCEWRHHRQGDWHKVYVRPETVACAKGNHQI